MAANFSFIKFSVELVFNSVSFIKNKGIAEFYSESVTNIKERFARYKLLIESKEQLNKITARSGEKTAVMVLNHNIGGGADFFIKRKLSESDEQYSLVITYSFPRNSFLLTINSEHDSGKTFELYNFSDIDILFKFFSIKKLVINELVTYNFIYEVMDYTSSLKNRYRIPLIIYINDYFCICPSYNLVKKDYFFCGICDEISLSCIEDNPDISRLYRSIDLGKWRDNWNRLLKTADMIVCFSESSREVLLKVFPGLSSLIRIEPHSVTDIRKADVTKNVNYDLIIGIPGTITGIKGSLIIKDMISFIEARSLNIRVVIIGTIDIKIRSRALFVTGRYKTGNFVNLVENNNIDILFIPSVCPETFSFTTEESIRMGVPVAVFNIGAPAERVKKYEKGIIIDKMNAESALKEILDYFHEYGR